METVNKPHGLVALGTAVLHRLETFPLWIVQLLLRISIAAVFWNAGLTKIASWSSTLALFHNEYHVPVLPPDIAAYCATAIELSCPVLLVIGLATRLATLPMLGQALIIELFVYPQDWIEHLGWVSILLFLLVRGPGLISIDHFIRRRFAPNP